MRKRTILTMLGMAVVCLITAQSRSPEVIAPAGGFDKTETISLEWTLGESATETIYSDQTMITQGFHQPMLKLEPILGQPADEAQDMFQIFPNPVKSVLEVKLKTDTDMEVTAILLDMNGQFILNQDLERHRESQEINMESFASGVYVLQFVDEDGSLLKSFKVIKTQ